MPIRPEHLPDEAPLAAPAEQQAAPPARAPTHQQLLRLQQSAGNAAVSRLIGARRPIAARFVDEATMGAWGGAEGPVGEGLAAAGGFLGGAAGGLAGDPVSAGTSAAVSAANLAAGGEVPAGTMEGAAIAGQTGANIAGGPVGLASAAAVGAAQAAATGEVSPDTAGGAASAAQTGAHLLGGPLGAIGDAATAAGGALGGQLGAHPGIAGSLASAGAGLAGGAADFAGGPVGLASQAAVGAAQAAATGEVSPGTVAGAEVAGQTGAALLGGPVGAAASAAVGAAQIAGTGQASPGTLAGAESVAEVGEHMARGPLGTISDAATAAGSALGGAAGGAPGGGGGGGGGGIDMDAPLNLGETIPALPDPAPPAIPALGQLGQALPALAPPVLAPPGNAPAAPDAGGFEQEAQGIEGAAQGGGGLLDSIVQAGLGLLQSITGSVAGNARGTAGAVGAHAGAQAGQAGAQAGEAAGSAHSEAQSAVSAATGEAHGHATGAQQEAKGAVSNAAQQAQQAPSQAAGMLDGLVSKVLAGAPAIATFTSPFVAIFNGIFGDLPGKLTAIIQKVQQRVDALIDRIIQTITGIARRIEAAIARIAAFVEGAISWVAGKVAALTAAANSALSALPGAVRSALSGLVSRLLGAVNTAAARIAARARALVQAASAGARAFLQRVAAGITAIVTGVKSVIDRALAGVKAAIAAVAAAIAAVKTWLIAKVQALIAKAIRAIIEPLSPRAVQKLIQLIGPEVQAAIQRAKLLFPNGLPAPPEVTTKAAEAAQQAGPSIAQQIKQGLLNPEGDHFGWTIAGGAETGVGSFGVSGSGGWTFDVVLDYRRNDIGFFIGPGGGATASVGDIGFTGAVSASRSWGTVASFGDPNKDVLGSWGGWFGNANYGVTVGGAYGMGASVSTGGAFYRAGAVELEPPIFSYTPFGADSHPVGPKGPDTVTPGTPGKQESLDLGEIHFATQQSDPDAAPGGTGTMEQAAQAVHDQPTKAPGSRVTGVRVVGEASRRWRAPRAGRTRAEENAALALQRATKVKAGLDARLHEDPPVSAHGAGDKRAEKEGKPETDGSPADQRAVIFADVNTPGTPDKVTPGTQPTAPNQHDVKVSYANPFSTERQAWGWDTTFGVSGLEGAGLKAQGYLGAGVSYSFPIGKTHWDAETMEKIRIAAGVVKILSDIQSFSPLGLLRDIIALARGHVAADVQPPMTQAVTSWSLPTVPGA